MSESAAGKGKRRWLAPEVIQTSAMDCGPAALKCLLEGFFIPASYGRLREACQTSVDGTSIDDIETVARQLGLDAEQVMLPRDYLWIPEAKVLPAMVVVRQPSGHTHFAVVWRRFGRWLQVMDPAVGRHWTTCDRFARSIFVHSIRVPASGWYEWASSRDTLNIIVSRLRSLGVPLSAADSLVQRAAEQASWHALAAVDAASRILGTLVAAGGIPRGTVALRLLESLLARTAQETPGACRAIPAGYWAVVPAADEADELELRGAVLLRIRGRLSPGEDLEDDGSLAPEVAAAMKETPLRPMRELWSLVRAGGLVTPLVLMGALGLAAGALLVEALLFRGLFDLARDLNVVSQRLAAFAALLVFVTLLWAFELPIVSESLRLGRHLETRLRLSLLEKLPKLNDRYLQSRPVSDMAERSHSIYLSRYLPDLAIRFLQAGWGLIFTLVGIGCITPGNLPFALSIAALAVGVPLLAQPAVSERDLRVRTHSGALQSFYLDAMLDIAPIRTHSAERPVRREHESLLAEWARSTRSLVRLSLLVKGVQATACLSLAGWLLLTHIRTAGVTGDLLLLVYWVLKLPSLGEAMAALALQYPTQRNIVLRLLEPHKALEETTMIGKPDVRADRGKPERPKRRPQVVRKNTGVAIDIQGVDVLAAGQTILQDIELSIAPGEHIAVVGPSGAGKSSLMGLLLGWHQPVGGSLLVDREPLSGERLSQLRRETAWVDPAIQIWNRSLLENLRYSPDAGPYRTFAPILESADLARVLVRLPEGLQSRLGESGARLSGGEGQRVRLARAFWQQGVRLVLLDEPFRGLDHERRRRHLAEARRVWQEATLICVTHDVLETRSFNRVIVVDGGQIVEDGRPDDLAAVPASRYRALLDIDESLRQSRWGASVWRRICLDGGRTQEAPRQFIGTKSVSGHD